MTKYDGQTITYDNCGNPTKYYNGKTWNMEWSKGRELSRITRGSKTWDFTYDMAGVRSGKTVTTRDASTGEITGTTEYKYTTLSGKLVRVEYNTTVLDIVYDESGNPFSIRYKSNPTKEGVVYYYVLNVQGDVVGLLNSSGELVVEYKYDPWGKLLETKIGVDESNAKYDTYNNMALRNPLRYRGYIYDRDTGLYYLQSRYYDPAIGRFINADTYTTTDADGLLSTNMFAYCENNPVNRSDPNGELHILAGALIGGLTSTVSALKAGEKGINLAISIGFGIASGALSAALPGAGAAVDVVMNAAESVVRGIANGENAKTIYKNAFVGAIAGAITGSMDNPLVSEKGAGQLGKFLKTAFGRKKGLHPRVKLSNKKFTRSYRREVLRPSAASAAVNIAVGYGSKLI